MAETCAWCAEHDLVNDVPIGPECGAPATHVIFWFGSARYSPCCDDHVGDISSDAPPLFIIPLADTPDATHPPDSAL